MALLLDESSGKTWSLGHRTSVGRASTSTIAVVDERVSGEHASIFYMEKQFWVRDLASRNGTWVDGVRIPTGRNVPLKKDSRIAVGQKSNTFRLVDTAVPGPSAYDMESGQPHRGAPDVLWLNSGDGSSIAVVAEEDGWVLEGNFGRRRVEDGEIIEVKGRRLRLKLPEMSTVWELVAETCQSSSDRLLQFDFTVSRDEESVALVLHAHDLVFDLGERAHNYLLLLLARARQRDASESLADAECGWVSTQELPRMLGTTPENMNHQLYRLRHQLEKMAFPRELQVIERRPSSRLVRLGSDAITIH